MMFCIERVGSEGMLLLLPLMFIFFYQFEGFKEETEESLL
jgi:hypothetical protein